MKGPTQNLSKKLYTNHHHHEDNYELLSIKPSAEEFLCHSKKQQHEEEKNEQTSEDNGEAEEDKGLNKMFCSTLTQRKSLLAALEGRTLQTTCNKLITIG
jgi:hypothetical protein